VCHNLRISKHKVFAELAARGKTSTGWFYGFKLHLIINHLGELLDIKLTAGNVDDRKALKAMDTSLFGKLYGDKGYIAEWLTEFCKERNVDLITKARRNMRPRTHTPFDAALLKKRSLVETVIDELKNLCQIEHTRHRSPTNFAVNLMGGIVAYCLFPNKPTLPLRQPLPHALNPN
jgi:transposase